MKVKELIQELSKLPDETEIKLYVGGRLVSLGYSEYVEVNKDFKVIYLCGRTEKHDRN